MGDYDASNEELVHALEQDAMLLNDLQLFGLKETLATEAGRAYIWGQLERTGMFRTAFAGEATHISSYLQGRQDLGRKMLEQVFTADPEAYNIMSAEAVERQRISSEIAKQRDDDDE